MDLSNRVGRFLVVLVFGSPSMLVVFARRPRQLPRETEPEWNGTHMQLPEARWVHVLELTNVQRLAITDTTRAIVERAGRVLAGEPLADDAMLVADLTEAGPAEARLLYELNVHVVRFRMVGEAGGYDRDMGASTVAEPDLASDLRVALQEGRLAIAKELPRAQAILDELTRGDLTSATTRAIALALRWGHQTGHDPDVSRKGTPENVIKAETRAHWENYERERRERLAGQDGEGWEP